MSSVCVLGLQIFLSLAETCDKLWKSSRRELRTLCCKRITGHNEEGIPEQLPKDDRGEQVKFTPCKFQTVSNICNLFSCWIVSGEQGQSDSSLATYNPYPYCRHRQFPLEGNSYTCDEGRGITATKDQNNNYLQ